MIKSRNLLLILTGLTLITLGYIYYFPVCKDLKCFKQHDAWFKAQYDASIPIYLTPENGQSILDYFKQPPQRQAAANALNMLAEPAIQRDSQRTNPSPITCAVVGNSGNLSHSGYGSAIDAHTYIFRMNNAPVVGYEQDVGARTTHHIVATYRPDIHYYGANTTTIILLQARMERKNYANKKRWRGFEKHVAAELQWILSQIDPQTFPVTALPRNRLFPTNIADLQQSGLRILHPKFLRYIDTHWFNAETEGKERPSTGFKTIILAMHLCDSIDIFGFGANKNGEWDHYFPDERPPELIKPAFHRIDFQERFLDIIQQKGISIYLGNASKNATQQH